jgi:hypothetical protein
MAPARWARRFGYTLAVLINLAILYVINVFPGWDAVPFLTDATPRVLMLLNVSMLAGLSSSPDVASGRPKARLTLPCAKVHIVEDDHTIRVDVVRALRDRGHVVTSAGTAMDGLKLALGEKPDVVLLDLGLRTPTAGRCCGCCGR